MKRKTPKIRKNKQEDSGQFSFLKGDVCRWCGDVIREEYCGECGRCRGCHRQRWHEPKWRKVVG